MSDDKHRNLASLLNFSFDGFLTPFVTLLQGGISVKTVIDIGSADGQFGLHCLSLKKDLHILNVEANRLFESSLKEIEDDKGQTKLYQKQRLFSWNNMYMEAGALVIS